MLIKSKVARFIFHHPNPTNFQFIRTFIDNIEIQFVRDRGLDHVVEREKDLKFVVNLKNLLKLEPSKSLPLSSIVDNLKIPCRAIDFIRKYPSFFEEYFPGDVGIHPHVRLTPESLNLDAEEQLIYSSDTFRKNAADRLLKLLMLCRVNEIPLHVIDMLKWDLGLPDNYVDTLVPEFPDYFKVKKVNEGSNRSNRVEGLLELVCWSDELAVSAVEKRAMTEISGYQKGMPVAFPLQYSKGFELDKRLKKWIDEWQRLPYVSPYENASHFLPTTDMSDKWAVAVLHELLHIFVPKKTERENLLSFGEFLGIKPRVKRAMAHHPGIFYRSNKTGTHTVVLREGYKRGLLIDKHPLMDMRSKYIHLMHKVKEGKKKISVTSPNESKQKAVKEGVSEKEKENGGASEEKMQCSDPDVDESSENEYGDDDDEEEEEEEKDQVESSRAGRRNGSKGSVEVTEAGRKTVEGRGRTGRNVMAVESSDSDDDEEVEQVERSRSGRKDGRRGSGSVNEVRGKAGFGRERPRRNGSRYDGDDGNEEERAEGSRGERNNVRRGFSKVNEARRNPEEGKGRSGRNARYEAGDRGNQARVESSRGRHNFDRRGSSEVNEGKRRPGEGRGGA
ncbi:Protein WHAT'S THIS FACTOR 1-like protein [Bienertia sinuspersici]